MAIQDEFGWNQYGRLVEFAATGYWKPPCAAWLSCERRLGLSEVTAALEDLAARHSALRCSYDLSEAPRVGYHADTEWPLERDDDGADITASHQEMLGATFAPGARHLKRALLVRGPTATHLGVALDHSICDAASLDLLVSELVRLLDGETVDATSDVRVFYRREKELLSTEKGAAAVAHWRRALDPSGAGISAYPSPPGLFADVPELHGGATCEVDRAMVAAGQGPGPNGSSPGRLNAIRKAQVFSAALASFLQRDSAFLMPFHRRRSAEDQATIGYLTSKIVVPCPASPSAARSERTAAVVAALKHGFLPHEYFILGEGDIASRPAPHVTLNCVDPVVDTHIGWRVHEPAAAGTARHNVGLHVNAGVRSATALWTRGILARPDVETLLRAVVDDAARPNQRTTASKENADDPAR